MDPDQQAASKELVGQLVVVQTGTHKLTGVLREVTDEGVYLDPYPEDPRQSSAPRKLELGEVRPQGALYYWGSVRSIKPADEAQPRS